MYGGSSPAIVEHSFNRGLIFFVATKINKRCHPPMWSEPARDATSDASAAAIKTVLLHPLDAVKVRCSSDSQGDT